MKNIKGLDETVKTLQEMFDYIKNPQVWKKLDVKFPKGYLFYGSPGKGKTFLAEALADTAGLPFMLVMELVLELLSKIQEPKT